MINLVVKDHSDLLLAALKIENREKLTVYGNDGREVLETGSLWKYSALVRSVLEESQRPLTEVALILADFSSDDIKEALEILEFTKTEDILISNRTKNVLNILGLKFENCIDPVKDVTENVVDKVELAEIQELLLADQNLDDDQEEKCQVNLKEGAEMNVNIKLEDEEEVFLEEIIIRDENNETVVTEDVIREAEALLLPENTTLTDSTNDIDALLMDSDDENPIEEQHNELENDKELDDSNEDERFTDTQDKKQREVDSLLLKEGGLWKCGVCNRIRRDKTRLRYHVETHVSGLVYNCELCEKVCTTKRSLESHNLRHHRDKSKHRKSKSKANHVDEIQNIHHEEIQEKEETSQNNLEEKTVHKDDDDNDDREEEIGHGNVADADLHGQKLKEVESLLLHENGIWNCGACDYSSLKKRYLKLHAETHIPGLRYKCKLCPVICTTQNNLKAHRRNVHTVIQRNIQNYKTSNSLPSEPSNDLELLKDSKSGDDEAIKDGKKKAAVLVGDDEGVKQTEIETDTHQENLRKVESLLIKEDGVWKCGVCSKTNVLKASLRLHVETHVTGLVYTCELCDKVCTTKVNMNMHKIRYHRSHISKDHGPSRKKRTKKNLRKKSQTAKGGVIQKHKFSDAKSLIEKDHGAWRCRDCGKSYNNLQGISYHVEKHLDMSHECTVCGDTFDRKYKLRIHSKRVHGDK